MNVMLAAVLTYFFNIMQKQSRALTVVFFLLVWYVLHKLKKTSKKVVFVAIIAVLLGFTIHNQRKSALVPNSTYAVLVSENESAPLGMYNVDPNHQPVILRKLQEDKNVIYYMQRVDALNALNDNQVSKLIIEDSEDLKDYTLLRKIEAVLDPSVAKDVASEPFLVYISGLDTDATDVSRSDMNILLAINPTSKKSSVIAIPRDTYLPLACQDGAMDKLTHASLYGVNCQIDSLENLFNVNIDFYVRVKFNGFVDVVDALDGIDVENDYAFGVFEEGLIHLDGQSALTFVRSRYDVAQGDLGRGLNGQKVLFSIIDKMQSSDSRLRLLNTLYPLIDTNIEIENALKLKSELDSFKVESTYLRGDGDMKTTFSQNDGFKYYVYLPEAASIDEINSLINDTLGGN